jgi:hypothetical protein
LEYFLEISRDSYFTVYLYQYFDCNENSFNLFENLCKFLSKNAFPSKDGEHLNIRHTLSLQCLLNVMYGISERCKQENKMVKLNNFTSKVSRRSIEFLQN